MQRYRPWLILFVIAFLLRLGMVFYWEYRSPNQFYFGDSDTYWQLGKAIALDRPYAYGDAQIHRMPGYPALLAPLFLLFGESPPILSARIENALIGSLTVLAVAWLAWILFRDRSLALLAGWITAVDPLNIVMSALVLSEAPFCLLMILQMGFWCLALRRTGVSMWFFLILAGLLAGATIYCRPSWLYFVPFATLLGILLAPRNFKPVLQSGLVVSIVCALCLVPWWYRNYQITGRFVSTTLQAGPSLYDGLNPEATGGSDMSFVEEFRNAEFRLDSLTTSGKKETFEYRLNQKMRQAAIDWAKKNPEKAWKLARSKLVRLWNVWPNEPSFSNLGVRVLVFCSYCPVLVLGLIGTLRSFWSDFSVRLLWIPAVYITALHIIFVSSIRYRAPAMICFAILAAWIIVSMVRSVTKKHGASPVPD